MDNASTKPLTDYWLSLPEPLRAKLRLGFTGKLHLLDVAGWCLRADDPGLMPIAADSIQTALGENPLDGAMAHDLLAIDAVRALLPDDTIAALNALAANWRKPDNTGYFERLLAQRDFAKLKHYIEQSAGREPDNLFWRQHAFTMGLVDNDPEWVESMMAFTPPHGFDALKVAIDTRLGQFRGQCHDAARISQMAGEAFGPAFASVRAGTCLLQMGDPASANLLLLDAVPRTPWNTSLLLRVHDQIAGADGDCAKLSGTTAVLLYSWNKAIELDATLRSLMASDLGGADLFVLDNGSTDETPDILASWQSRFDTALGKDRFTVVTLPVNVGAPAARNWLMHMEKVQKHDFICYLDDDVEVPTDWLRKFGGAVERYPDAGVWGCKVVDHANPALLQSADSHLQVDPDAGPSDLTRTAPNPFRLSDLHIQNIDTGLLDILRPCASVTGCCHLFRTATLLESGDFAIHLSPSQYDDMEHDLRLCEAGKFPVYQGHLAIRHRKRTGAASRVNPQEEGNALGNKYKMQTMHDREALLDAMQAEQALLEQDILNKIRLIESVITG